MAQQGGEDRSREDLTEEASPYRIEEMRQKGMVAQSREVSGLLALFGAFICLYNLSPTIGGEVAQFMREMFRFDLSKVDLLSGQNLERVSWRSLKLMGLLVLPIGFVAFLAGALGSFAQVGAIFTTEPLQADLSKIDPIKGFGRVFSFKQVIEGFRLMFKVTAVVAVAYSLIKAEVFQSMLLPAGETSQVLMSLTSSVKGLFFGLMGVLTLFAAIDYGLQRFEYQKNTRMTKQEAKEEHRERDGDPAIKARIRAVQREMARKRMMQAVKKADVIITNPTHIAVAIVYERDTMAAPKVVAKGADFVAQKIKALAAEAGVPCVENVPLARTLYKTVKLNHFVPRALYQAVAEVLAFVYKLKRRNF